MAMALRPGMASTAFLLSLLILGDCWLYSTGQVPTNSTRPPTTTAFDCQTCDSHEWCVNRTRCQQCRLCGPGFGVKPKSCHLYQDTICLPCQAGYYSASTSDDLCWSCTPEDRIQCSEGYYHKTCTPEHNTMCVPCSMDVPPSAVLQLCKRCEQCTTSEQQAKSCRQYAYGPLCSALTTAPLPTSLLTSQPTIPPTSSTAAVTTAALPSHHTGASSPGSASSNDIQIIGIACGVIGTVVILIMFVMLFWFLRYRKQESLRNTSQEYQLSNSEQGGGNGDGDAAAREARDMQGPTAHGIPAVVCSEEHDNKDVPRQSPAPQITITGDNETNQKPDCQPQFPGHQPQLILDDTGAKAPVNFAKRVGNQEQEQQACQDANQGIRNHRENAARCDSDTDIANPMPCREGSELATPYIYKNSAIGGQQQYPRDATQRHAASRLYNEARPVLQEQRTNDGKLRVALPAADARKMQEFAATSPDSKQQKGEGIVDLRTRNPINHEHADDNVGHDAGGHAAAYVAGPEHGGVATSYRSGYHRGDHLHLSQSVRTGASENITAMSTYPYSGRSNSNSSDLEQGLSITSSAETGVESAAETAPVNPSTPSSSSQAPDRDNDEKPSYDTAV